MFFSDKKIENNIIHVLRFTPLSGPVLLEKVQKIKKISKESFYRVLRQLLREEVVIKNKLIYSLNSRWIEKLSDFINSNNQYQPIDLDDGDQITYTFKNPQTMYNYWAYVYDIIFEKHNRKIPILLYHSYQWFIYAREESEKIFLNKFTKNKQLGLLSIGNNDQLQKSFKNKWSSKYLQINTGISYGNDNTVYINVVGDYIFKVYTTKKFASKLDLFFKTHSIITEQSQKELLIISQEKDKTKLVIKRSRKESQKWLARYKKDFVY
jgi:hypothetical protein